MRKMSIIDDDSICDIELYRKLALTPRTPGTPRTPPPILQTPKGSTQTRGIEMLHPKLILG